MTLPFYKYQGTGNDFVMIDNRSKFFDGSNQSLIASLCHRRFGIGADGLILLEQAEGYDFKMVYFNADGRQGSMCGNGGRCIVQFAFDLGIVQDNIRFIAVDGPHDALVKNGLVHLKMIDVTEIAQHNTHFFMNTGSPHYVQPVQAIDQFSVIEEGRKIRYNDRFKIEGTNVNFSERIDNTLHVRTYERGVEDETYSCGTGVTAAALAASYSGMESPISISTLGGSLSISFEKNDTTFKNIFLIGPAKRVFEGNLKLPCL